MIQPNRVFCKGKRDESPPQPTPKKDVGHWRQPVTYSAGAGIRSSFKFANVPSDQNNIQGGVIWHH